MNRSLILLMGVVLWGSVASAQKSAYDNCLAKASNGNRKFACNSRELRSQDKRVDADYRKLQRRFQHDPQKQADVRTDQRDWLAHRDATCSQANQAENLPCMIRETSTKAGQLDGRLQ